jgi:CxxC motif-containing protein (DUF1111 family)
MGPGLADGVYQGSAGADQFRTAPLWGIGKRLFFLHDGRTSDLLRAIEDHGSGDVQSNSCRAQQEDRPPKLDCSSEADTVIRDFRMLNPAQVQDILNFLRSL